MQQQPTVKVGGGQGGENRYIRTLKILMHFLNQTSGRDKAFRLIQYVFRVFKKSLQIYSNNAKDIDLQLFKKIIKRVEILIGQMSTTRKVLRLGKEIGLLLDIRKTLMRHKEMQSKDDSDPFHPLNNQNFVTCSVFSNLFYFLQLFWDHIHWACTVKIIKYERLRKSAFYFIHCCNLFQNLFFIAFLTIEIILKNKNLQDIKMKGKEQQNEKEVEKINNAIDDKIVDIIGASFEIPIILANIKPGILSEGYMYILGSISSSIMCFSMWNQCSAQIKD